MAFPIVAKSPFPQVPDAAGVPALARQAALSIVSAGIVTAGNFLSGQSGTRWGIYTSGGKLAVTPDSFMGIEFNEERRISDYPVEKGSFATYNKVTLPYRLSVKLVKGGSVSARDTFVQTVMGFVHSLDLYAVVVPEGIYRNLNFIRADVSRHADNGAEVIVMNLHCEEVRIVQASTTSAVPSASQTTTTTSTGSIPATGASSPTSNPIASIGQSIAKSLDKGLLLASSLVPVGGW